MMMYSLMRALGVWLALLIDVSDFMQSRSVRFIVRLEGTCAHAPNKIGFDPIKHGTRSEFIALKHGRSSGGGDAFHFVLNNINLLWPGPGLTLSVCG